MKKFIIKKIALVLVLCGAGLIILVVALKNKHADPSKEASQPEKETSSPIVEPVKPEAVEPVPHEATDLPDVVKQKKTVASPEKVMLDILTEIKTLDISGAVRDIVGLGKKNDYQSRIKAMRKLGRDLSSDDIKALMLFLDSRSQNQDNIRMLAFNGVKNDVLTVLLAQDELPEGFGSKLVEMYNDNEHDDVWRDYCVQYFAEYYQAKWAVGEVPEDDKEHGEINSAYWQAVTEKDKTIAGTALIGLESLSRDYKGFDREKIKQAAVDLANDPDCLEASKITALRMCGMLNNADALPSARIVAQTGETTMLRMAAIATVGDLGDEEDIEFLNSMVGSSEKRISAIAKPALERVKARISEKK
ncbi:hypothetical protein ACFLS1_02840 [Verrucomicrobiota bacterium]